MRKWYNMKRTGDTVEVLIYDIIGQDFFGEGVSAANFVKELADMKDVKTITARINSPGGMVYDGIAIYNALVQHPAAVNVHIDGMALSIASIIAMAGDTINMAENAMMMIHDPWIMMAGTADDLRKEADVMDKAKDNLVLTYANRTGLDAETIGNMMTDETWLTAAEAVDQGFATDITAAKKMAACAHMPKYRHTPDALKNAAAPALALVEPEPVIDPENTGKPTHLNRMRLAIASID